MPSPPDQELERTIGVRPLALNVINLTVGAGIFVVPAVVAQGLGPTSFMAYLMCAGLMILVMLCFAEVGSKVTAPGGSYAYVEHAFGHYAGFLINFLHWFGFSLIADAAIANAMADMIGTMWPLMNEKIVRVAFFCLMFGFFGYMNIIGVKSGARLMVVNTLLKLIPLLALIGYGIFHIKGSNLIITDWPPLSSYGEMALILFFAFAGGETSLGNSGEIKDPQTTIPKGIFLGLFGVLGVYLSVQFVAQGILGSELAAQTDAPLARVAQRLIGDPGYQFILFGGIFSIYALLSGDVLATSRLIYSGAKNKIYPPILARIHPKFKTPYYSIGAYVLIMVLMASLGEFRQLALISSSAILIIYIAVALATIKIRWRDKDQYEGAFTLPFGYLIPILACLVVSWFLWHLTQAEWISLLVFFVVISIFYWLYSRKKINR